MANHKRHNIGRKGQAVVEFALVLPILLVLLLGAMEFGRVFFRLHLLTDAAREGARVASLPDKTDEDVKGAVGQLLEQAGVEGVEGEAWLTTVAVRDPDGALRAGGLADAQQEDRVHVTVASGLEILTGTIVPGLQGTVELSQTCVFRHE